MSIKINSLEVYYEELKKKLSRKNMLILDLKKLLFFHRHDKELSDFLIQCIYDENEVVRENAIICVYLLLIDFGNDNQIYPEEEQILKELLAKANINLSYQDLVMRVNKEINE